MRKDNKPQENEIPVYFARMIEAAKSYILSREPNGSELYGNMRSGLQEIVKHLAHHCDGNEDLLGENPKQSKKYKRIIYAAKTNAALKAFLYGWDLQNDAHVNRRVDVANQLSEISAFQNAICAGSDIRPADAGLGIGVALFYYAAFVGVHDPYFRNFVLLTRHLNLPQLQKLKKAMEFADRADIFSLLGDSAKPASRKYKQLKPKREKDPSYQVIDAFIARREKEQQDLRKTAKRQVRGR